METYLTPGVRWGDLEGERAPDKPHSLVDERWDCYLFDFDPQIFNASEFMNSNKWWLRFHGVGSLYGLLTVACTGLVLVSEDEPGEKDTNRYA